MAWDKYFLNAVVELLFFTILSYPNVLFCLLGLSIVFLGAYTTTTRREAQGRSPAPLQHPKPPEHRQTPTRSLLALYSQLSIPHSTTACLFPLSGAVVLPACYWISGYTKLSSGKRERAHMDSIFFAHMFTHLVWNTTLRFASLSPNSSTNSKSSQFSQPNPF